MENFQLNDELVKEFVNWRNLARPIYDQIPEFKKLKQPKPLFTTRDGKEIYKGNIYFYVDGNYNVVQRIASDDLMYGFIKFSTKGLAENYVINNMPCLSLKEVMSWASGKDSIAIRDTVIHKLNF